MAQNRFINGTRRRILETKRVWSYATRYKLKKLKAAISRSSDDSVLLIEALVDKYKANSNDTPKHWRLEYAGAADDADGCRV